MPIKPPPPDYSHLPPGKPEMLDGADWYHREVINPLPGKPEGTRQYFKAKVILHTPLSRINTLMTDRFAIRSFLLQSSG
jgi:hypothetical protein